MVMKLYERVFNRLRFGETVLQIQQELHLPPSRLQRILHSKRFQHHLELQRESTRAFLSLMAADMAYWTFKRFADLMDGRNEETTRKVCLALLNTLVDGRHSRPLSSSAPKVHQAADLPAEFLAACQSALASAKKQEKTTEAVQSE